MVHEELKIPLAIYITVMLIVAHFQPRQRLFINSAGCSIAVGIIQLALLLFGKLPPRFFIPFQVMYGIIAILVGLVTGRQHTKLGPKSALWHMPMYGVFFTLTYIMCIALPSGLYFMAIVPAIGMLHGGVTAMNSRDNPRQ